MVINNGGSAFPGFGSNGASVRTWAAVMAMNGLFAGEGGDGHIAADLAGAAQTAVNAADALIAELEGHRPPAVATKERMAQRDAD